MGDMVSMIAGPLIGGLFSSSAADKGADATLDAAKVAADAAKFRPYSITAGFGSSTFDPTNQTATYALTPQMQALRDQYYGMANTTLGQLGNLDPNAAAQQWMAQQQGLLEPTRTAEDLRLRSNMLNTGRIGLGVSSDVVGAGAGGYVNPQQFALDRARAMADAQMAAQAQDYGQKQYENLIARASGLLQTGTGIEQLGLGALTTGADLGKAGVASGNAAAQALLQGGQNAANINLASGLGTANAFGNAATQIANYLTPPPPVVDGGYNVGQGSAYGGTVDSFSGLFTPSRRGM